MKKKRKDRHSSIYSVRAKASTSKKATTGKIVVNARHYNKSIPAVIFAPDQADELLELIDDAYSSTNKF